jgi:2-polyprenyl-6-methoxyphenol hydroxylase-like FAD-dependent oxidoreductase
MRIGIVGGGIGGLSAAICLSRIGIEVEVFERASAIRESGAGVSLWPNATRVLAHMGLLQTCLAKSLPLSALELVNLQGKSLLRIRIDREEMPVICMRRPELLAMLHSQVADTSIHLDHDCTRITTAGAKVTVEFERRPARSFDAVIGADGARSLVRSYVTGVTQEPAYRGYSIWRGVAQCELGDDSLDSIQEIWGSGRRFGILPIGKNVLCWYATDTRGTTGEDPAENRKRELLSLFRGWPSPIPEILRATPPGDIVKNGAADLGLRGPWFKHRVTIIGDAAHPLTPNVGQGCCLALEDSLVLSLALQQTGEVERAFHLFGQARRKRVAAIVRATRWIGSVGQARSKGAVFIRDQLLPAFFPLVFELAVRPIHRYDATKPFS